MASGDTLAERITWLVDQPKTLLGVRGMADWQRGNNAGEERISWPIALVGQPGLDAELCVVAYPHHRPQEWHINFIAGERVMGLDHEPEGGHLNSRRIPSDNVPLLVSGPHAHLWSDNLRFCLGNALPKRLPIARAVPSRQFDSSLRWFCDAAHITFPSGAALHLPPREQLPL